MKEHQLLQQQQWMVLFWSLLVLLQGVVHVATAAENCTAQGSGYYCLYHCNSRCSQVSAVCATSARVCCHCTVATPNISSPTLPSPSSSLLPPTNASSPTDNNTTALEPSPSPTPSPTPVKLQHYCPKPHSYWEVWLRVRNSTTATGLLVPYNASDHLLCGHEAYAILVSKTIALERRGALSREDEWWLAAQQYAVYQLNVEHHLLPLDPYAEKLGEILGATCPPSSLPVSYAQQRHVLLTLAIITGSNNLDTAENASDCLLEQELQQQQQQQQQQLKRALPFGDERLASLSKRDMRELYVLNAFMEDTLEVRTTLYEAVYRMNRYGESRQTQGLSTVGATLIVVLVWALMATLALTIIGTQRCVKRIDKARRRRARSRAYSGDDIIVDSDHDDAADTLMVRLEEQNQARPHKD